MSNQNQIIMRAKVILLAMTVITLSSCYKKYTLFIEKGGEETEEEIRAENDTLAYLNAYRIFIRDIKVAKDMEESFGGEEDIPEGFRLMTDDGRDITDIEFSTKTKKKEEIEKAINGIENVFSGIEVHKKGEVDSVAIKELAPFFNEVKDEFDVRANTFWVPKSKPKYLNTNWVYLYFSEVQGRVGNLRMKIQYTADEWLFIRKYIFSVDGSPIEMLPDEVKRDNGNGMIWEWCDQGITDFEAILVERLENANTVKIKLEGDNYYKVRTLSKKELLDIQRTIKLYKAKGGTI